VPNAAARAGSVCPSRAVRHQRLHLPLCTAHTQSAITSRARVTALSHLPTAPPLGPQRAAGRAHVYARFMLAPARRALLALLPVAALACGPSAPQPHLGGVVSNTAASRRAARAGGARSTVPTSIR